MQRTQGGVKTVKVTIVSPTYNEAENVMRLVHEVSSVLSGIDYELLIADDDSPDRTWAVAQELAMHNPRLRVLRRRTDRGLSPAVIESFLSSYSDYVGVIDADLQHDPAILPKMIAALDAGAGIAVGSRYVEGGGTGTWNAARRFQSWVATKLAQTFLGVELTDPMSGYFILRRDDFSRIHKQLDSSGFKILLEIIADWPHRGLRRFRTHFEHVWLVNLSCPQKSFSSTWDNFGSSPLSAVTCPFDSSSSQSSAHQER